VVIDGSRQKLGCGMEYWVLGDKAAGMTAVVMKGGRSAVQIAHEMIAGRYENVHIVVRGRQYWPDEFPDLYTECSVDKASHGPLLSPLASWPSSATSASSKSPVEMPLR
jgi:hypothetical protein